MAIAKALTPFRADGKAHYVYELTITNLGRQRLSLDRVIVLTDPTSSQLADYDSQALTEMVVRPGLPVLRGAAKLNIGAGQRAMVYLWVSAPNRVSTPRGLRHRISMKVETRSS